MPSSFLTRRRKRGLLPDPPPLPELAPGEGTHVRTARGSHRWLREPLIHFIALGAALLALYHWVAPPASTSRIVLSEAVIRGLRQDHLRRNGALPTSEEEAALIQRFVDDEVLYREALALGLERGDIIVRRRLMQKMEFLTEGLEPIPEPTDAELQAFQDAHATRYVVLARVAMTHVFASADRHPDGVEEFAQLLREELMAGADPSGLGDPFLRGRDVPLRTERELAAIFGTQFAAEVMSLPAGSWSAPVRSSYGLHLVRVTQRTAGYHPSLAEVREAVRRDCQEQRRTEATRTALDRLRQRYEIRIEGSTPSEPAAVAGSR